MEITALRVDGNPIQQAHRDMFAELRIGDGVKYLVPGGHLRTGEVEEITGTVAIIKSPDPRAIRSVPLVSPANIVGIVYRPAVNLNF